MGSAGASPRKSASSSRYRWTAAVVSPLISSHSTARRKPQDDDGPCNDEWFATLSHELRSPLVTILDALELVSSDLERPGAKRAGDIAQHQAKKAMQLIDDLFDLAAHSCGKLVLDKETVQVDDIVARATETANHLITARKHSLTVLLPP